MKRNAKSLQSKSRRHEVTPTTERGLFRVTSATSGNTYSVRALSDNSFRCACDWAKYHPSRPCSHTLAVLSYLEVAGRRALSFWASEEDAERQHKPTERVSVGLWATSRRAYKVGE